MENVIMYINGMIPYIIVFLPIYAIIRYNYLRKKEKNINITQEVFLAFFLCFLIGLLSQTIIPEFEYINGKIEIVKSNILYDKVNLIPFNTIIDNIRYGSFNYFFINVVGNIVMFTIIGIFLPMLFERYKKVKSTLLFGFFLSLSIEIIQILLPRATDVDDIILNVVGIFIGYLIYKGIYIICGKRLEKICFYTEFSKIIKENNIKKKVVLVTGASSGIGYEMAKYMSSLGFYIIAVSRNEERLKKLKKECKNKIEYIILDLSREDNIDILYEKTKNKNIDIVINNAGFGLYGEFESIDIDRQMEMIKVNIMALQKITYIYLKKMKEKEYGYILNVSSSAAFLPGGPYMASYYASKSYVYSFTNSLSKELSKYQNIHISCLCPGPVNTNFNNVAGIKYAFKAKDASYVAKYAIYKFLNGKKIIIPGMTEKITKFLCKVLPDSLLININCMIQKKKKINS